MKFFILSLFMLFTCQSNAQTTIETVTVQPYKELSYGAFFKSLTIRSDGTHAEYIDGFEYEWGYTYELKIKATKLSNPPMDGGDTEYELLEVISKTKAIDDFRFNLRLESEVYLAGDSASSFEKIGDRTFLYLKEIKITVTAALLKQFQEVIENGKSAVGVFGFTKDGIELVGFA